MTAFDRLCARFRRVAVVEEAVGVLYWDAAAMLPPGAASARSEQIATLRELAHSALVAPGMEDDLAAAAAEPDAGEGSRRAAQLDLMRRRWQRAAALPSDLVAAISRARSRCEQDWRAARAADDYALVRPALEALLVLVREEAAALGSVFGTAPYDALLDGYEPGLSVAECNDVFARLETFLPDLLERALARQAERPAPLPPAGPFPVERQAAFARELMATVGFEFDHGRLDTSAHPFCGGSPDDLRITTRYDEGDFLKVILGVLHETGHGLYERGLPVDLRRQPAGEARGMAVHESQSLIVEMQACRSREFASWFAPRAKAAFGGSGDAWDPDNVHRLLTRVDRGLIRVDANEIAYPLHIILRFRIEQALLSGDLPAADLPSAWNEAMAALLGVRPASDRDGCLQDIHWYDGAFGYFPTYTLGAMMAAQLFASAEASCADLRRQLGAGDFRPLLDWLRRHVHRHGALRSWDEILRHATGAPLDVDAFRRHLTRRYLEDEPPKG